MFEMDYYTIIGMVAAFCTTASFLPQAIRVIRTKRTRDISLGMYLMFTMGIFLWLLYGILTRDIPIIIANAVSFVLSFTILILKLKYK